MLEFPKRVWLAQREYERFDGIETVEAIVTLEDLVPTYRDKYSYKVTEYVEASALRSAWEAIHTAKAAMPVGASLDLLEQADRDAAAILGE
jgi:hypothetical protein